MFKDDGSRRTEEKGDFKIPQSLTAHSLINRLDA